MPFTPTSEQQQIMDAFATGQNLVIEAGAGTGKTSTMQLAAEQRPHARGLYIAFNKAVSDEAAGTFGRHVRCRTAHKLAYDMLGHKAKPRLNSPRQPAKEVAHLLGIRQDVALSHDVTLSPTQQARLALNAVSRFCNSADRTMHKRHVPRLDGVEDAEHAELQRLVLPHAETIWTDLQNPTHGRFKYEPDVFLKQWQLAGPQLGAEFILFDEGQDASPVIAEVVQSQTDAQLVTVGDSAQSIYGWRGAVDVLRKWPAQQRLRLSESFRFGPAVANEANKWLTLLGRDMRITGRGGPSHVGAMQDWPDAVLCRTNAGAVREAMDAMDTGFRTALVGGAGHIRDLAEAAIDLQAGRGTSHPELVAFQTWAELQDYCDNDASGADLKAFVSLIDKDGPEVVLDTVSQLSPEFPGKGQKGRFVPPEVVVSTAHKAKGRQWPSVRIGDDFKEPLDSEGQPLDVPDEDAMLAYVAVTRAMERLDTGGLSWIDGRLSGKAPVAT